MGGGRECENRSSAHETAGASVPWRAIDSSRGVKSISCSRMRSRASNSARTDAFSSSLAAAESSEASWACAQGEGEV